ncbi:hypothetical protein [Aquipuribacter nitratireducens]|uniref:Uncharacterized protein n=1 Tax=Aquipuribacter nitratireducens TaxID=650104 RepID=A0ABW0GPI1_9MICO
MKIGMALRELHRSENELARALLEVSERHRVDHDVFYLGRELASWSQAHVRALADAGSRYDVDLDPEPVTGQGLLAAARERWSDAVGRDPRAALRLLVDVREVYTLACGVSVDWELVAQAAQGVRDAELLALSKACHPETLRQMRWANAKLKESATQILVS